LRAWVPENKPMTLKELREECGRFNKAARDILNAADADGKRDLTAEESGKVDELFAAYDAHRATIERLEHAQAVRARATTDQEWLAQPAGRRTASASPHDPVAAGDPSGRPRPAIGSAQFGRHTIPLATQMLQDRAGDAYGAAMADYMRSGGRRIDAVLHVGSDPQGGYLTAMQQSNELIKFVDDAVFMRQISTVLPPLDRAVSLGVVSWDTDPNDADWTAEVPASDIAEDTAAALGKREMMPHLMTKRVDLSMKLIRSAAMDVVSLVTSRVAHKMAITEEKAFLTGDGAQQALGVFVASTSGISTARDVAASSTTAFTWDDVINVMYGVKEQYQRAGSWLISREWLKRARKLKSGTGEYLWQPSLVPSEPPMILGRPYFVSEHVPDTYTTGLYVALFGDFKAGYYIVDTLETTIQVLDQVAALKNKIVYLGRKETDGQPVLEEAFARMILA
jgi:HK97 family phage major capsid protein